MIASNYRKFPEAMALQLVLVFGQMIWHTARPTTKAAREIRAERGRLVKARAQVVQWAKVRTPSWWKSAKAAATALSKKVKSALLPITWDQAEEVPDADKLSQLVHDLVEDFLDTQHGQQQRPLQYAIKTGRMTWAHVPSGMTLHGAEWHQGYRH